MYFLHTMSGRMFRKSTLSSYLTVQGSEVRYQMYCSGELRYQCTSYTRSGKTYRKSLLYLIVHEKEQCMTFFSHHEGEKDEPRQISIVRYQLFFSFLLYTFIFYILLPFTLSILSLYCCLFLLHLLTTCVSKSPRRSDYWTKNTLLSFLLISSVFVISFKSWQSIKDNIHSFFSRPTNFISLSLAGKYTRSLRWITQAFR